MSLRLFRGGRFLRLDRVVDLLDDLNDHGLGTPGVFRSLWRDGLITRFDKFTYCIETADSHIYHRLEVWAKHETAPFSWYVLMTLKETSPILPGVQALVEKSNTAFQPPSPPKPA